MVAKQGFSPIEQYRKNASVGPWTDVYSMAATIYYCCTGVLPPSATDRMIEDTLTCRPRLTKEEFDVLAFCMSVLPQKRPQNMDALLQIVTHPAGKTPPVRDVPKTEPVRPETPEPPAAEARPRPSASQMADPRHRGGGGGDSPHHFHRQRRKKSEHLAFHSGARKTGGRSDRTNRRIYIHSSHSGNDRPGGKLSLS